MPESQSEPIALPKVGELLAEKYRIKKLLGRGGMGAVYQAQHEILDKTVAIKFLLPSIAEHPQAVARFLNEARATARLNNEHVAAVLDVGTMPNGCAFMVLEYLDGRDLAQTLEARGALPMNEAVEYLLQALEALAQAHAAGIIHRDLKPANLFLTRRPDGLPSIKVLDFGISKAATVSNVTATSSMLGSPSYMSPEQIKSSKHVDPRSDIWSLGVVLYQLVSGELPFKGEGFGEVFAAVFEGAYTPLEQLRPELPPELCAVVARCLNLDREKRFPNVGELADGLKGFAFPNGQLCVERIHRLLAAPRIQAAAEAAAAEPLPAPRTPVTPSAFDAPTSARPAPGLSADPKGNAKTTAKPAAAPAIIDARTLLQPARDPQVQQATMAVAKAESRPAPGGEVEALAFPRRRGRKVAAVAALVVVAGLIALVASGLVGSDGGGGGAARDPVPLTSPLPLAPAALVKPAAEPQPVAAPVVAEPAAAPAVEETPVVAPAAEPQQVAAPVAVERPAVAVPAAEPQQAAAPAVAAPPSRPAAATRPARPARQPAPKASSEPEQALGDDMLLDRR